MLAMKSMSDADLDALSNDDVAALKAQARTRRSGLAAAGERLVAEGDSWFDFLPGTDLIDCLESQEGFRIDNFGRAGDTLENMIFGSRVDGNGIAVDPPINRVLEQVAATKPRVLLFSGGGNDVVGDEFAGYLNHADSGLPVLREQVADQMIATFGRYLQKLLEKVAAHSPNTRVLMHGYGHALPSGRGVGFFGITFVGPWMLPALLQKGVRDGAQRREVVRSLIDRYNTMLLALEAGSGGRFLYVDLRDLIRDTDWRDELHLKNSAYRRCAGKIADRIRALPAA
jgi:lysophospholipase L1-like esterase